MTATSSAPNVVPQWRLGADDNAHLVASGGRILVTVAAAGDGQPIRVHGDRVRFAFDVPDRGTLPPLDERFIRGDTLHLMYPQSDQRFAVRLSLEVLSGDQFIADNPAVINAGDPLATAGPMIEARISVQTDLLDTHPMIDLRVAASESTHSGDEACGLEDWCVLNEADRRGSRLVDKQCVQLFGDFLEKGVIRRAQPWLMVGSPITDSHRSAIEALQSRRPVFAGD